MKSNEINNKINNKIVELNDEMLEQVNGGTFTMNMFEEEEYHKFNIKTCYHFLEPDEFWLPDGRKTNEEGANDYINQVDPEFYQKHAYANLKTAMQYVLQAK